MNSKYRSWRWIAAVAVLGLLVAACGGDGGTTTTSAAPGQTTTTADGGEGSTTTAPQQGSPGLETCNEDPLNCNSAPRAEGGDVVYLIDQRWDGWNINRVETNSVYAVQAVEGMQVTLGQYMPDGNWVWNMDVLASEPTYENSTITYELKEGVVWTNPDGSTTPVSVDDFILQWKFTSGNPDHCLVGERDPDTGAPAEGALGCFPASTARSQDIVDITADGNKVMIQFPEGYPYAEWFAYLGGLYYPAHIAEAEGFDLSTPEGVAEASTWFNTTVPNWSGGPYVIEDATLGERVVMVPNEGYYGSRDVPTLDTVTKELVEDRGSWIPALTNRDIHGASPASFDADLLQQLQGMDDVTYSIGSGGAVWEHVDMNMETLADPALRKAIFTAIDRADARTRIYGDIEPTFRQNPIFPANDPNYFEDLLPEGYGSGDVDAARAILEEAGYTGMDGGAGALTDPNGQAVPTVRFGYSAANTNRGTFVQLTQSYLAEIGINVEPVPADNLGALLVSPDWDMVIFGWSGSPLFTSSADQFYNSESGSNFGGLNNPEVDELVSAMLVAETLDEAADLANQAVAIVFDEAYTLTLWDTMNLTFMGRELVNARDNHFDSTRAYHNVGNWGLAAAN